MVLYYLIETIDWTNTMAAIQYNNQPYSEKQWLISRLYLSGYCAIFIVYFMH